MDQAFSAAVDKYQTAEGKDDEPVLRDMYGSEIYKHQEYYQAVDGPVAFNNLHRYAGDYVSRLTIAEIEDELSKFIDYRDFLETELLQKFKENGYIKPFDMEVRKAGKNG